MIENFKSKLLPRGVSYPPVILVHGEAGMGKSTLALEFPRPLFMMTEHSFPYGLECDSLGNGSLEQFHDNLTSLEELCFNDREYQMSNNQPLEPRYKTLVIDHVGGVDSLICSEIEKMYNVKNIANIPFGNGYEAISRFWESSNYVDIKGVQKRYYGILPRLEKLSKEFGICLLFLAHSKKKFIVNPGEPEREMFVVDLTKKTDSVLSRFVSEIIFISSSFSERSNDGKNSKFVSTGHVLKSGNGQPTYQSKTRCGLPLVTPFVLGSGFKALSNSLPVW